MLPFSEPEKIFFLDIETAPQCANFNQLPEKWQKLWEHKTTTLKLEESPESAYRRAGIYAEFGRVVCVCVGRIQLQNKGPVLRIRTFHDAEEVTLLRKLSQWLSRNMTSENKLCAHNGKEFDFPWMARRMLINRIPLQNCLQLAGKKPWEVPHLDTLEMWKFGDYKHYTSLNLLAETFGIVSPKKGMDGQMVAEKYWNENAVKEIVHYCCEDVRTLAELSLIWASKPSLEAVEIIA
jgi:uncharacterized protein YprB with RNaseH-like and TPR domain